MYVRAIPAVSLYVQKGRMKISSDCVSHIKASMQKCCRHKYQSVTANKSSLTTHIDVMHLGTSKCSFNALEGSPNL